MLELLTDIPILHTISIFIITLILAWIVSTLFLIHHLPPGPFPLPIFGNLLLVARAGSQQIELFDDLKSKYGKIFTLTFGAPRFIVINDLQLMQEAFVKHGGIFSNRPHDNLYILKIAEDRVGRGLILADAQDAKQIRKASMAAMRDFGVGKKSLEEKIVEEIHVVLEVLDKQNGKPLQLKSLLSKATSNIISSVIFGSRFSYDEPIFVELLQILEESTKVNPMFIPVNFFPILRFLPPIQKQIEIFMKTFRSTDDYIKKLTTKSEETFDPNNIRDFVDITIAMRNSNKGNHRFNEKNMRHVIVDLFIGGSDTTATSLLWIFLYVASYPEIQAKCHQEIDAVLGKSRSVTSANKSDLKYVEATIYEVLRLRPVAPLCPPHCVTHDTQLAGYTIPKSAIVTVNIMAINKDPNLWSEPDKFNPGRFLDGNGNLINKEKVVSFSVGPRSCIGENLAKLELFLMFTSILQFYSVQPAQGSAVDLTAIMGFVYQPKDQDLIFIKRESN